MASRATSESGPGREGGDGRLARAYFGLAGLTYGLIVLGALVRAHGAGLSCPDWPLCFGDLIPQLDFKVAFEFGHRVLAGCIAIFFALLGPHGGTTWFPILRLPSRQPEPAPLLRGCRLP